MASGEAPAAPAATEGTTEGWLATPSVSVTAAVAAIAANPPPAPEPETAAAAADPSALRLTVRGQVCRKRHLSKNLMFLTIRQADSCVAWDPSLARVQTIAKLQSLGAEQMADLKRLVKLGDMMQVEGVVHAGAMGPELLLEKSAVVERWAVSCRGEGFKPDIEPPSDTGGASAGIRGKLAVGGATGASATGGGEPLAVGADAAPLCKFWVNTGVCKRTGCRFSHGAPGDKRDWKEIRTEWQRERSAKRHANRKTLRMDGDNATASEGDASGAHGDRSGKSARAAVFAGWLVETFGAETLCASGGVIDVAGGRGELSFELAAKRNVLTTLLDPRHPGKLSKTQRKFLTDRPAGEDVLPQRVRAMLTLEGAARVGGDSAADAAAKAASAPAAAGAAAAMSVPATAGDKWKGKKARPDALASAAVGWRELPPALTLEALLATCSAMIGMHPDQATEPLVRCAIKHRRHWAIIPCCVFAADFPDRTLPATLKQPPVDGLEGRRPVNSYEDLVEYLIAAGNEAARSESEKVQRGFLPFIGKNQVLWQKFE